MDGLRRQYFPPALNLIPAHLTLFHKLEGDVATALRAASSSSRIPLAFNGLRKLGGGVALAIDAPALIEIRRDLARTFAEVLSPQDRQGFRPHVTIQNKVAPEAASALHDAMLADFEPFVGECQGLLLWRYLGGPWTLDAEFPFAG